MRRILTMFSFLAMAVGGGPPAIAQGSYMLKTGSLTATSASCTATACVFIPAASDVGSVMIQLAGTFSATVSFEASVDGTNYAAVPALPLGGGATVTSATAGGVWMVNAAGLRYVRARVSAFTSGTVSAALSRSSMLPMVNSVALAAALSVTSLTSSGAIAGTTGTFSGAISGTTITGSGAIAGTAVRPAQVALTSASNAIAYNLALGNSFKVTLQENTTMSVSNITAGQLVTALICQDGTGSRTFTWPASFKAGMTIASTASKCNAQSFLCDASACWATSAGSTGM